MRILICEFMDERAVNRLRSAHDVHYDAALVDDAPALLHEGARADAAAAAQYAAGSQAGEVPDLRVCGQTFGCQ